MDLCYSPYLELALKMYRFRLKDLVDWIETTPYSQRRPLILRGARQVGKTWLIRELAQETEKKLIEINFEKNPEIEEFFRSNDPQDTFRQLVAWKNLTEATSKNSLLFLDEIQRCPGVLPKLRWFFEEFPELPVVCAGSLLEFALDEIDSEMPVGRYSYMYLEPLSFLEFLNAHSEKALLQILEDFSVDISPPISQVIHEKLMNLIREYIFVGGMPQVVSSWVQNQSLHKVEEIKQSLIAAFKDDIAKYRKKVDYDLIIDCFETLPRYIGEKFRNKQLQPHSAYQINKGMNLLKMANIFYKAYQSHGNGIPLGSEKNNKVFKINFLDIGMANSILNLRYDQIKSLESTELCHKGPVSEQLVGQLLRASFPYYTKPFLFHWRRESKGSSAEIDFLYTYQDKVIPIEVKAGKTGTLKSLHLFMAQKNYPLAIRVNADKASVVDVKIKSTTKEPVQYKLLSIPFYMVEFLESLVRLNIS
jgi:uncharacterized protein